MSPVGVMQVEALGGAASLGAILQQRLDDPRLTEVERVQALSIFAGPLHALRALGHEHAEPRHDDFVARILRAHHEGRTILVVAYWRSSLYVGPLWARDEPGCPRCLLTRLETVGAGEGLGEAEPARAGAEIGPGPWGPAVLRMVAELVVARVERWARGAGRGEPEITVLHGPDGTSTSHGLIPDSMCPLCGAAESSTLPTLESGREAAKRSASEPGAQGGLRQRSLGSIDVDRHVSPFGLLRASRVDLQSPFGASALELPSRLRPPEPAIGRARSYRDSRAAAVLEGLERFCGMHRGGRRAITRASYRALEGRAVPPPSMGTHPASSHAREGFPYVEFSDELEVDWVEAYSYQHDGPRYVPERAAFWGPRTDGEPSFFFETSNGCALGSSVEEATLHGLRELIERDAFLLTWYRRLALPEIDLSKERDPELLALLRRCELFTGFRLRAFWSSMGLGMSSVWLVAIDERGSGPCVLAGGAAHPDPRQAIIGGLYELCGVILATMHRYSAVRTRALELLQDPEQIRHMEDHSNVGCLPEARERFSFLLDRGEPPVALDDLVGPTKRASIHTHLHAVVDALAEHDIDVLVVDQTMPEVCAAGFRCVKVIAPGLLPMTFGHLNRRTMHLPRLLEGAALPFPSQLPPGAEVGHVPHPFP